ncbi:hypothetical protein KM043_008729 [Ampulex compressa]|nr:hypothetical protein KM043_008729 [Ampulex compressa]
MRVLAMLERRPILPTAVKDPTKYPQSLTAKIAESPYGQYWRKPWLFGYWTVAMILCFPILYKMQVLPTSEISAERLETPKRADVSESKARTEETARIAEGNRGD